MTSSRTKDEVLGEDSALENGNERPTAPLVDKNSGPETFFKTDGSHYSHNDIARSTTNLLGGIPPEMPQPMGDDISQSTTRKLVSSPSGTPFPKDDATIRLPSLKLQSLAKKSVRRISLKSFAKTSHSSLNIAKRLAEIPEPSPLIIEPTLRFGRKHQPIKSNRSAQPPSEQKTQALGMLTEEDMAREDFSEDEVPGDVISRLDTISILAVQPREELSVQQDIFINNWVEDITVKETLQFPLVRIIEHGPAETVVDEKAEADKRKIVASTAGAAAIAGIGDLASAIIKYVTTVLMTNLFSKTIGIYGIFVETNTVVTVLGYASKLGLDSATLRFLSTYRAKGERGYAAGLIRFALLVALISGLIWGVSFFALSFVLAHFVFRKDVFNLPFKESALLVPLIGIQLVTAASLQAFKAIKWKVYVDRLIQPGVTLVLLVVFYLLGLRLEALIFATTCGYIAAAITGQIFLKKVKRKLVEGVKPQYDPKTWAKFAFPMFFNSMIRNILNSTDVLFLGAVATQSQLALYGAADRVSYFVVAPLIALNAIFSPVIAEYHAKGQHQQLEGMFKIVTKWSFSLSLPVFLCCLVFHDAILGIFTAKYLAAGLVLIILAFGNLVDSFVGSVNYLLVMTGRPKVILVNTVTTVVVNVALALFLVPRFNILGAALAAALTVVILNIVGLIEVYHIMKIHPYRWDTIKPLIAGAVASLVGLLLNEIVYVSYGYRAIFGVVLGRILPFVLVYAAMLALLRFSEEDMMVFDMVRAKFENGKKKAA